MLKKFVMATNNANKLREVREILSPLGIEVVSLSEVGVDVDPDENGPTFEENSRIKAQAVFDAIADEKGINLAVIADDSGLCVDALGGAPGIHSARYAPKGQECAKLLDELNGVARENRTARFVCGITLLEENGIVHFFEGACEGIIGDEMRGTNGFGYDPVFLYGDKTLAEMSAEDKNKISHRACALAKLYEFLKERYCD